MKYKNDLKRFVLSHFWCSRPGSNRHGKKSHRILSPGRLPIPPLELICNDNYFTINYIMCQ